jgi:acyl-CoA synthetase
LGERACAYVVLNHAEKGLTLSEVKVFFEEMNVAKYKYPERIEIVDFLPRNESCKIKKYLLREDIKKKMRLVPKLNEVLLNNSGRFHKISLKL